MPNCPSFQIDPLYNAHTPCVARNFFNDAFFQRLGYVQRNPLCEPAFDTGGGTLPLLGEWPGHVCISQGGGQLWGREILQFSRWGQKHGEAIERERERERGTSHLWAHWQLLETISGGFKKDVMERKKRHLKCIAMDQNTERLEHTVVKGVRGGTREATSPRGPAIPIAFTSTPGCSSNTYRDKRTVL